MAMIAKAFKRIVTGEAMYVMVTKIQDNMVSFKFHLYSGAIGQKNTDLVLVEILALVPFPGKSMLRWNYL